MGREGDVTISSLVFAISLVRDFCNMMEQGAGLAVEFDTYLLLCFVILGD